MPSPATGFQPWASLPSSDRKSTRLNSSLMSISYAVFCLKKKKIGRAPARAGRRCSCCSCRDARWRPRSSSRTCSFCPSCRPRQATHRGGCFFFFNDTATTEIYSISLHDALPICTVHRHASDLRHPHAGCLAEQPEEERVLRDQYDRRPPAAGQRPEEPGDED